MFIDDVDFSNFAFGTANFDGATFNGQASFDKATFERSACFRGVTFKKAVTFKGAKFACPAMFEYDEQRARAEGVRPQETVFKAWADFRDGQFEAGGRFGGARFESRARFGGATFGTVRESADGSFEGARFASARTFGPVLAWGRISLDRASFEGNVRIGISARGVSCARATFLSRSTLEIRFADVFLDDAEFALPSVVGGSAERLKAYDADQPLDDAELEALLRAEAELLGRDPKRVWKPRVRSLSRANVANLTLADSDLTKCRFVGAHNLDRLRFEGVDFARTEGRATRRRMIAEERDRTVPPDRLARTYRALRKGREDNKDEPGAAGFYYGEMQMRRKAASGFEWLVLSLYWALSGYGLRASRAVAALVVTVLVAAALFHGFSGFDPDQSFGKSLLFSAESTSSLFRASDPPQDVELNDEGHVYQMGVRLLGPLFFGLALLALRGRVKR